MELLLARTCSAAVRLAARADLAGILHHRQVAKIRGDKLVLRLSRQRKKLFRRYIKTIENLIEARKPLSFKCRLLVRCAQKGGFLPLLPIIAPILASALGALGAEFIPKLLGHND